MGAIKASGLAFALVCAATVGLGTPAALAGPAASPGPVAASLTSAGAGTAVQSVVLPVPDAGHVTLLDPTGIPTASFSVAGVGSYEIDGGTGVLTFRPAVGYVGMHGVLYRATDAFDQSDEGTYTPQVMPPDAPAGEPLRSSGIGTAAQTATAVVPDSGNAVLLDPAGAATTSRVLPGIGEFGIEPATGIVTFTPVSGYAGSQSIDYRVSDAYGQSATAAYTADVRAPDAPVAVPVTSRAAVGVQQSVRISVPAGATPSLVNAAGQPATHVYLAGRGNYALAAATIVFTPAQGFHGVSSLAFRLTDAYGKFAQSVYTATVLQPRAIAKPAVVKARKHPAAVKQRVVLVPPIELFAPVHVKAVVHRVVSLVSAEPAPVRAPARRIVQRPIHQLVAPRSQPRVVARLVPAAVAIEPLAAAPVVASPVSGFRHSNGRLAGAALVVVNLCVGAAALVLNRRRRNI